jgi:hypothetical protein
MNTGLSRRWLASIRWRSGLDAELEALRSRVASIERSLNPLVQLLAPLPTRGSVKAYATPADADLLEHILLELSGRFDGSLDVLEWGSGLSTLYYPQWLRSRGVRASWTSFEYDRALFRETLEAALRTRGAEVVWSEDLGVPTRTPQAPIEGLRVIVFDEGSLNPRDGSPTRSDDRLRPMDDYVATPARLARRFHAVIVDGRKRDRCLREAARLVDERGVVLLHDAQRPYYHAALSSFRSGRRMGDEWWIGAQADTDFSDLVPAPALSSPGFEYVPGT